MPPLFSPHCVSLYHHHFTNQNCTTRYNDHMGQSLQDRENNSKTFSLKRAFVWPNQEILTISFYDNSSKKVKITNCTHQGWQNSHNPPPVQVCWSKFHMQIFSSVLAQIMMKLHNLKNNFIRFHWTNLVCSTLYKVKRDINLIWAPLSQYFIFH